MLLTNCGAGFMCTGNNGAGCGEPDDEAGLSLKFSSGGCTACGKGSSGASEKQTDPGICDFCGVYYRHDRWNHFHWHGWKNRGFNNKKQIVRIIAYPFLCMMTAGIFMLL